MTNRFLTYLNVNRDFWKLCSRPNWPPLALPTKCHPLQEL